MDMGMEKSRKVCDEAFYLTKLELTLLLGAAEVTQLHGLGLCREKQDEQTCLYALQDMSQKGIVLPANERFVVQEPYRRMLQIIKDAHCTLAVRVADENVPDCCIYCTRDAALVSERSRRRKNSLLLRLLHIDALFDSLLPAYFPDEREAPLSEAFFTRQWLPLLHELHTYDRVAEPDFLLGVDVFKRGVSMPQSSALVVLDGRALGCVLFEAQETLADVYDKEKLCIEIKRMMGFD